MSIVPSLFLRYRNKKIGFNTNSFAIIFFILLSKENVIRLITIKDYPQTSSFNILKKNYTNNEFHLSHTILILHIVISSITNTHVEPSNKLQKTRSVENILKISAQLNLFAVTLTTRVHWLLFYSIVFFNSFYLFHYNFSARALEFKYLSPSADVLKD